mgnify:CR=1 FL=1
MKKITFIFLLSITACNYKNPNIVNNYPRDNNLVRKDFAGNMFNNKDGIVIFKDTNNGDKKNDILAKSDKDLWKKTIATISEILPISIVDDQNSLIVTDWGNIDNISKNNNKYKVNIIFVGEKQTIKDIKISIFRQDKTITTEENQKIKDKIINLILSDK